MHGIDLRSGAGKGRRFTLDLRKRVVGVVSPATLAALSGTFTLAEDASAGTVAGALSGKTVGSTLSLADDAGGRVALSGSNVVRGATALDYDTATSHAFTVRETLAGATNTPRDTVLSLAVTNVLDAATLGTLALSDAAWVTGTSESGTITGATVGSTITGSGLPTGFTINGAARTWAWDGTGSVSSGNLTLTETLADSPNSPKANSIAFAITAPATLSAGSIAFDTANGWTAGQNLPAIAITLPADGTVSVGDFYRIAYGTSSTLTGATNAPWHEITSDDVLNETLGMAYSWGIAQLPSGTEYMAVQFGRGADAASITLTSLLSNIINDTYSALASFTAASTQPVAVNNSFAASVWTFAAADFVAAGYPVIAVKLNTTSRTISSVVLKSAGAAGADITFTQVAVTGSGTTHALYVGNAVVAASGSYVPVVTLSGTSDWVGILCGTLKTTTPTPSGTAIKNTASTANPVVTSSALTVPANGIGVAFASLQGSSPLTANSGTLLATGMNGNAGLARDTGAISKQATAGSWTPSFNEASQNSNSIVAAAWSA